MIRTGKQSAELVEKAVKELNDRIEAFTSKGERANTLLDVAKKYGLKPEFLKKVAALA